MVKKTPAYKNKLRALELQRTGGMANRKKGNKQMDKYEHICRSLTMPPESSGLAWWNILAFSYGLSFKFVYLLNLGLSAEFAICDRKVEEELGKELNLDIKGTEKPSVWELIGIRFILLPYTLGKVAAFLVFYA